MIFDIDGRASGKTYRLLEWLINLPSEERARAVIISPSTQDAMRLFELTKAMIAEQPGSGIRVPATQFRTVNSWEPLTGRTRPIIAVDNLDLMLRQLLRAGPDAVVARVTATGTPVVAGRRPRRRLPDHYAGGRSPVVDQRGNAIRVEARANPPTRMVTIRCTECGLEVTGLQDALGTIKPARQPVPSAPVAGLCFIHASMLGEVIEP